MTAPAVIDDLKDLQSAGIYPDGAADALALKLLAKSEGFESTTDGVVRLLEAYAHDSVVPGWCKTCNEPGGDCEPDARANWCEICGKQSIASCLDLAGII